MREQTTLGHAEASSSVIALLAFVSAIMPFRIGWKLKPGAAGEIQPGNSNLFIELVTDTGNGKSEFMEQFARVFRALARSRIQVDTQAASSNVPSPSSKASSSSSQEKDVVIRKYNLATAISPKNMMAVSASSDKEITALNILWTDEATGASKALKGQNEAENYGLCCSLYTGGAQSLKTAECSLWVQQPSASLFFLCQTLPFKERNANRLYVASGLGARFIALPMSEKIKTIAVDVTVLAGSLQYDSDDYATPDEDDTSKRARSMPSPHKGTVKPPTLARKQHVAAESKYSQLLRIENEVCAGKFFSLYAIAGALDALSDRGTRDNIVDQSFFQFEEPARNAMSAFKAEVQDQTVEFLIKYDNVCPDPIERDQALNLIGKFKRIAENTGRIAAAIEHLELACMQLLKLRGFDLERALGSEMRDIEPPFVAKIAQILEAAFPADVNFQEVVKISARSVKSSIKLSKNVLIKGMVAVVCGTTLPLMMSKFGSTIDAQAAEEAEVAENDRSTEGSTAAYPPPPPGVCVADVVLVCNLTLTGNGEGNFEKKASLCNQGPVLPNASAGQYVAHPGTGPAFKNGNKLNAQCFKTVGAWIQQCLTIAGLTNACALVSNGTAFCYERRA